MRKGLLLVIISLIIAVIGLSGCGGGSGGKGGGSYDDTSPSNVINLSAIPGDGSVTLGWEEPSDADFEGVEISYNDTELKIVIVPKGTTIKEITGLTNGTTYTFTVKSVDTRGNKSSGVQVSATPMKPDTSDRIPPGEVTNLQAVAGDGKVTLSWVPPGDPDFAKVEITYNSGGPVEVVKGITSKEITGLTNGTSYTFTVKTIDTNGNKSNGVQISAIPADTTPPSEVTNLQAVAGDGKVTLSWNEPGEPDFAKVEITYNGGGPVEVTKGTTSKVITGLTNGTSYTFTVKTVDTNGNKSNGVQVSATPRSLEFTADAHTMGLWHLNEGAGSKLVDVSGNKLDFECGYLPIEDPCDPSWADSGRDGFGKCLYFNRSEGDQYALRQNIVFPNQVSLEFWIKTDISSTLNNARVFGTFEDNFRVHIDSGKIFFQVKSGHLYSTTVVNDNNWHYIACTYDGSVQKIYIDGNLAGIQNVTEDISGNSSQVYFGYYTQGYSYLGYIDEIRLSSIARTEEEIAEYYSRF